ncbi:MAG: hypothetical protein M3P37_00285 [Actinomycetota bacterium]|nr:hypothetical protein [Actinomycetota bacterium]
MSEASRTQLVMVGSSTGGIEALSKLVSKLPEDFPAPIVSAQHLDPKRESHLQPILANRSALPVRTVSYEEPLENGVIFVVPANNHINITDSHIGMRSNMEGRPKPSVDARGRMLFRNKVFHWRFGNGTVGSQEGGTRLGDFVPLNEGGESLPTEEMPQVRASRGEAFETRFATGGRTALCASSKPGPTPSPATKLGAAA